MRYRDQTARWLKLCIAIKHAITCRGPMFFVRVYGAVCVPFINCNALSILHCSLCAQCHAWVHISCIYVYNYICLCVSCVHVCTQSVCVFIWMFLCKNECRAVFKRSRLNREARKGKFFLIYDTYDMFMCNQCMYDIHTQATYAYMNEHKYEVYI